MCEVYFGYCVLCVVLCVLIRVYVGEKQDYVIICHCFCIVLEMSSSGLVSVYKKWNVLSSAIICLHNF